MIYFACSPTHGTDAVLSDPDELAEVRWCSLTDAEALLPGMFEPVREYLRAMMIGGVGPLGGSDR
jgi:hypothetical protein